MQVSKQSLQPKLARELSTSLHQLIADLRSTHDVEAVLKELLSETERVAIMKRLGIILLLNKGMSYDKIKQNLKVSSATIASIQERMGSPGLKIAIEAIKVNVMAENLAHKFVSMFSFIQPKK